MIVGSSRKDDIEMHQMVEENDANDMVKQFDQMHGPQDDDGEEVTSPMRNRINQIDKKTVNYFSMNDEDIEKEKNKIKDDSKNIIKDLESTATAESKKKDVTSGWEDDMNGWTEDADFDQELEIHI